MTHLHTDAFLHLKVAHKHVCVARVSYRRNSKMLEHVAGEAELGVAILQVRVAHKHFCVGRVRYS